MCTHMHTHAHMLQAAGKQPPQCRGKDSSESSRTADCTLNYPCVKSQETPELWIVSQEEARGPQARRFPPSPSQALSYLGPPGRGGPTP